MKKLPFIAFVFLITPLILFSQEIVSVMPVSGFTGETKEIYVTAQATGFQQGVTEINMGEGINITATTVTSAMTLNFTIEIDNNSPPGQRNLTITTGTEIATYENAFQVMEPGEFNVVLTVIPADPLYLSSFDPDDPANSPMVFLVDLFNNEIDRQDVKVEFVLSNDEFGKIGSATKEYPELVSGGHESFDNRQFDEYDIESTAGALLDEAMQTGMLPPGNYTYTINVYDDGNLIGGDFGYNDVTNLITSIDLIGPGNPTDENPEIIFSPNPYFQWFSMANAYDFTLYEVMEGQTAPDEITTNLPVYQEPNLGTTQFLYPNYAELLEIGKTYAWQVNAYFEGSMGQETVYSDVFWFSYQQGEGIYLDHIVVLPEEVTLNTGETYQFHAVGINTNGDTVQISCEWQVIPSYGGSVDENGLFTSGGEPVTLAVVANADGLTYYSTVTIKKYLVLQELDFERLILLMLGLIK